MKKNIKSLMGSGHLNMDRLFLEYARMQEEVAEKNAKRRQSDSLEEKKKYASKPYWKVLL